MRRTKTATPRLWLSGFAACRGAINSLLVEIIDGEIRFRVLSRNSKVDSREAKAAEPR